MRKLIEAYMIASTQDELNKLSKELEMYPHKENA